MSRIVTLLGLMVTLVVLVAGVAVAVDYRVEQCREDPCRGTDQRDLMYEQERSVEDHIYGLKAGDRLDAGNFGNDHDVLFGGPRGDVLITVDDDGRDTAWGGRGSDRCLADDGDRVRSCQRVNLDSAEAQAILAAEAD